MHIPPLGISKVADLLPNPSLITEPAKMADMISISSKGICEEDLLNLIS
jgi:hypothetical protein